MSCLCRRLDELWEENRGCEVLFTWIQFLKEETLDFVGIVSPLEISRRGSKAGGEHRNPDPAVTCEGRFRHVQIDGERNAASCPPPYTRGLCFSSSSGRKPVRAPRDENRGAEGETGTPALRVLSAGPARHPPAGSMR